MSKKEITLDELFKKITEILPPEYSATIDEENVFIREYPNGGIISCFVFDKLSELRKQYVFLYYASTKINGETVVACFVNT